MCLTFDEVNPFDTLTGVYVDPKNVEIVNYGKVIELQFGFNGTFDRLTSKIPGGFNKLGVRFYILFLVGAKNYSAGLNLVFGGKKRLIFYLFS